MTRFLAPQGTSQCACGLTNVEDRKWPRENRAPPAFEAAVLSMLALTWDTVLALLAP